jgi:hypothetical protein
LKKRKETRLTIVLRAVRNIPTVVLCDFVRGERIVMNFSFHRVIFSPLIGKGLQECTTTGPRASKNYYRPFIVSDNATSIS